jgi:hypothetical protein
MLFRIPHSTNQPITALPTFRNRGFGSPAGRKRPASCWVKGRRMRMRRSSWRPTNHALVMATMKRRKSGAYCRINIFTASLPHLHRSSLPRWSLAFVDILERPSMAVELLVNPRLAQLQIHVLEACSFLEKTLIQVVVFLEFVVSFHQTRICPRPTRSAKSSYLSAAVSPMVMHDDLLVLLKGVREENDPRFWLLIQFYCTATFQLTQRGDWQNRTSKEEGYVTLNVELGSALTGYRLRN